MGAAVMLTERDSRWRGEGRGGLVVGAGLEGEQLGVEPAGGHELAVGAAFGELPAVEDGDEVGHAHGGEAVGDEHGDATVFPSGLRGCGRVALEQVVLAEASRAAAGSSRMSSRRWRRIRVRARPTVCHWPPDSSVPSA